MSGQSDVEHLSSEDVVVLAIGPTGSGKSTFIEKATGITGIAWHGLQPYTSNISIYRMAYPGLNLCFVDTPGFDDTNNSDLSIFTSLAWLLEMYKKQIRPTALLYFHKISDNRLTGTALKNFKSFEQLCEDFGRIVFITTMWDEVEEWYGIAHENNLRETVLKGMIERGASIKRSLFTTESAFEILVPVFDEVLRRSAVFLQQQLNMPDPHVLLSDLEDLVRHLQGVLGRVCELTDPTHDQLHPMVEDYHQNYKELQHATEDMRQKKRGWLWYSICATRLTGLVSTGVLWSVGGLVLVFSLRAMWIIISRVFLHGHG